MRIKINAAQVQKDILRIQRKLQRLAGDIQNDSQNKIQEVGTLGFNYAVNLAPEYTGALKAAMRLEITENQALIISSHPKGDLIPIHIMFDTGEITALGPQWPRIPGSLGFMKQTTIFLEQEFSNRLKMAISHSIERVGKVR